MLAEADPLLAVGTRFTWFDTMNPPLRLPASTIHIDVDPSVIGRSQPAALAVAGDARLALEGLLERVAAGEARQTGADGPIGTPAAAEPDNTAAVSTRPSRPGQRRRSPPVRPAGRQSAQDHSAILDAIDAALPRTGVVVCDSTVPAYTWANRLLPGLRLRLLRPPDRRRHRPRAAVRHRCRPRPAGAPVALVSGDGGFMFHIGELATLAEQNLPVIICLFDDGGFGVLRGVQDQQFPARIGVDLHTPDFAAVAEGMGVPATRVDSAPAFAAAFDKAVVAGGPHLLHIAMDALAPIKTMGAPKHR